ncbi:MULTISPECIES: SLBB domain-containing protein [unclassified Imperialibacter]|uniref:SLBB domain-containing protein n=1 Tax=unclassified Imperialibacter TaxID=2629706 RepID=UPI0012530CC5|nr:MULTISPECIES: SLBB domain-containing protein [unclassified Imperialibacter]CAD5267899.1 Capsule biosynthesis protein [Imperialibacter sp. 89]CAD5296356.1 Capsule biosynthesis protein [Imperialibacter sp. 75]VVT33789.1 Capsule biosynthesis protein [Imperialibacter sp. EC-SDR9]
MTFSNAKYRLFTVLFLAIFIGLSPKASSQAIPDLSTINVDNLSDAQIVELMSKGTSMGYSPDQMLQLAQSQGLSAAEVNKLSGRVNKISSARVSDGKSYPGSQIRGQHDWDKIMGPKKPGEKEEEAPLEERIFGYSLFNNESLKLTFEPSLNMPTPQNYVLGPGDVLFIDIYGASEQYFEARVNAEGKLVIANFGPISVSGQTIDQAKKQITDKLAVAYIGLQGATPNTFINVSLGLVRTIKVNMVGELRLPGTYTLSSLSTVFNALYAAGGITTNGTFRNIKVFRKNKLIATVDAYDFLIGGNAENNIMLQEEDVIIVDPYTSRVEVKGEVKRPGIFELSGDESFKDVLHYAGGFTDQSYKDRVNVTRNNDAEKMVADVFKDQFEIFTPKSGDVYRVGKILDRYANRVQIKGAVFRAGSYSLSDGLTLTELIKRADGPTGDAYASRATITRTLDDLSTETISFDLAKVLSGENEDIAIQREDIVTIFSKYDLKEEYYVTITGEVNQAGEFSYSEKMTVEDLIAQANGLREAAAESNIEITRRVKDLNSKDISDIIVIQVDKSLGMTSTGTVLEPFDHVVVRRNPNYRIERFIQIDGEVLYPGKYAIRNVNEKISDVVKRAGGLSESAYPKGATLIRRTEFFNEEPELSRKMKSLEGVQENIEGSQKDRTESQNLLSNKIDEELYEKAADLSSNEDLSSFAKRERLAEMGLTNPFLAGGGLKETEIIGINLEEIMSNPGSKYDLILEEGDVVSIPKQLQTVRLRGRVLYPTTVRYENSKSVKYFIDRAGGFDSRARKGRTYVVYANGEVARTKGFLFMRNYPNVEPGAEIIIPVKPLKIPLKPGDLIGVATGLATIALVVSQIAFK